MYIINCFWLYFTSVCLSQTYVTLCIKHDLFRQRRPKPKCPKMVNTKKVCGIDFGPPRLPCADPEEGGTGGPDPPPPEK